jgi:3-hydroxyisobutyrate dehydrogenase-like beta-hydroxyacid dehydrogenase
MAEFRDKIGWIGTGRMGFPMAERLARAGAEVTAWNRTRSKAEPLAAAGVRFGGQPAELAGSDIVFTMVAAGADLKAVTLGPGGLFSGAAPGPAILVDCSTVDAEDSEAVRAAAEARGTAMLAAPVSGNGKVVRAGKASLVVSGPKDAYDRALPYLERLGQGVSYVGEGERARVVKICHNVFLGVVIQSLCEITALAEKSGVKRAAFLDFINKSVMGSMFTRYKSPALVNCDFSPTFTPVLLRKDLELGLAAGKRTDTPMPLTALTREIIQNLIGLGFVDQDFATLMLQQARNSGYELKPENVPVNDGLS